MKTYKRHRFRPEIISYAVWLYFRFNLSHRDVEDLLANNRGQSNIVRLRMNNIEGNATLTPIISTEVNGKIPRTGL
jgi:hypothetical protein